MQQIAKSRDRGQAGTRVVLYEETSPGLAFCEAISRLGVGESLGVSPRIGDGSFVECKQPHLDARLSRRS